MKLIPIFICFRHLRLFLFCLMIYLPYWKVCVFVFSLFVSVAGKITFLSTSLTGVTWRLKLKHCGFRAVTLLSKFSDIWWPQKQINIAALLVLWINRVEHKLRDPDTSTTNVPRNNTFKKAASFENIHIFRKNTYTTIHVLTVELNLQTGNKVGMESSCLILCMISENPWALGDSVS